jgi:two-component system LytT family response regulator
MRTCFIVDDEPHAINSLKSYVNKTPGLELTGFSENPLEALAYFQNNNVYADITFVDIDMPHLSGIELSAILKGKTEIVFTTAFPNFAPEAFEFEISDYLLKPFSYARFIKCINKINDAIAQRKTNTLDTARDYFFIQSDSKGKLVKIYMKDIIYIESLKNYLSIVTNKNKFITYLTLSEIEEKLPPSLFLRIHKSFIINIEKLSHVEGSEVFLFDCKESLTVGVSYKDAFFERMNNWLIKTKRSKS